MLARKMPRSSAGAALSSVFLHCGGCSLGGISDGFCLGFDLCQLALGDEAGDLLPIAGHFLEHNRHLLGAQVATTVDLSGEAAQNLGIAPAEANAVVVAGVTGILLIGGLKGVNLDQTLDRPGAVGGELVLEVALGDSFHVWVQYTGCNGERNNFLAQNALFLGSGRLAA